MTLFFDINAYESKVGLHAHKYFMITQKENICKVQDIYEKLY